MTNKQQYIGRNEILSKRVWQVAAIILALLLALLLFVFIGSEDTPDNRTIASEESITAENCVLDDCLQVNDLEYPAAELSEEVISALNSAVNDEYLARATYEAVMDKFGNIRPFSMIIRAEEQHLSLLRSLYDKYDLDFPTDPHTNISITGTRADNCSIGVQAEIDNAALYRNKLLPIVTDFPDITSVFTKLMNDSQTKHLPAFEKCAN